MQLRARSRTRRTLQAGTHSASPVPLITTSHVARGFSKAGQPWSAKRVYTRLIGDPGSSTRANSPFRKLNGLWVTTPDRLFQFAGALAPEIIAAAMSGSAD